ncbi:hypothetical protein A3749_18010 [Oleiphilus sp. HI0078]|jgi:VCBS repeat-containing protein|nr:hypothetical protein A3743_08125 [Oleiphilus sp. HI0072]KZZ21226.1 hypothetical protein A3749_18010 [Oleiphilus sp. HI0078]
MSAQPSLLVSTRLFSSQVLEQAHGQTTNTDINKTSPDVHPSILLNDIFPPREASLNLEQLDTASNQALQAKATLKKLEHELSNANEQQLNDIATLQDSIINDEDFDFSLLPSTAAGYEESPTQLNGEFSSPPGESFSSNAYVETSTANSAKQSKYEVASLDEQNSEQVSTSTAILPHTEAEIDHSSKSLGTLHRSTTEDIHFEVSGQVDTHYEFDETSHETAYGQINYNSDGSWQYTLDNNTSKIQELGANDSLIDSIDLISKSGDKFTLNITIHGINDSATISGDKSAEVSALSNYSPGERPETISGTLTVKDLDQDEAQMLAEDMVEGTYGFVSISASGEWTYSLNSESDAVKSLHQNDTLHDLIPLKSVDGTNQLLKITIFGADDKPFLSGDNSETIDLATSTYAEQKLNIDDPDFGQSHFIAAEDIATRSNYGTGSIDEHGNWRYELNTNNPKVISLGEKERLFDTFVVESVDGTTQTVIIKIEGSDQPLFANNSSSKPETLELNQVLHDDTENDLESVFGKANSSHQSTGETLDNANTSASEILQQITQQNLQDNNLIT